MFYKHFGEFVTSERERVRAGKVRFSMVLCAVLIAGFGTGFAVMLVKLLTASMFEK